jgi:hypothetical protein
MSRITLGLVLALLLLVSLVLFAPARLVGLVLPAEQIAMQGFSGTLWHGSASRCLVRTGSGLLHLGAVSWSLKPFSLLTFSPRLTLDARWGRQRVSGAVVLRGDRDVDLHDFEATVAADLLRQVAPVALGGNISAGFTRLVVRDGMPVGGEGRLVWQDGTWSSPTGQLTLGSYAVEFVDAGSGQLRGDVITLAGPVEAAGEVELDGQAYRVDVLVGGKRALDPRIGQALALIASPENGGFRLQLDGDFRQP